MAKGEEPARAAAIFTTVVKDFDPMLGHEVLVVVWEDGTAEVAFRQHRTETWGLPTPMNRQEEE